MNKRLKALKTYASLWAMKVLPPVITDVVSLCVTGKTPSPTPCQTSNGLQPDMPGTRQEEHGEVEAKPEKQQVYRYEVEVSTYQLLYQTVEIVSDRPLEDEQIAEPTFEAAQKGVWERGAIDPNIDINNVTEM
jgi:hypothetical protein